MNSATLDYICSSNDIIAALCLERKENTHSVCIWVQNCAGDANFDYGAERAPWQINNAHIIIPVEEKMASLRVQQILSLGGERNVSHIVILCCSKTSLYRFNLTYAASERRVTDTELIKSDVDTIIETVCTNTSCTLIATFSKSNGWRKVGLVTLLSSNLQILRSLEATGLSSEACGLLFIGDHEQFVTACCSSGWIVVGMPSLRTYSSFPFPLSASLLHLCIVFTGLGCFKR